VKGREGEGSEGGEMKECDGQGKRGGAVTAGGGVGIGVPSPVVDPDYAPTFPRIQCPPSAPSSPSVVSAIRCGCEQ
jgi:hypothetical protein